jgi:prepilin-type N-terminal cleavage/methylation domain-containing protein
MIRIPRLRHGGHVDADAGEAGFTLIEMIVSLAILGIALGVLFAGFSQVLDRQRLNDAQMRARLLATSLLDETTAAGDLKPAVKKGITADGLAWSVAITPYGDADDQKAWRFTPAHVTVTVTWSLDGQSHDVTLRTLAPMARDADR